MCLMHPLNCEYLCEYGLKITISTSPAIIRTQWWNRLILWLCWKFPLDVLIFFSHNFLSHHDEVYPSVSMWQMMSFPRVWKKNAARRLWLSDSMLNHREGPTCSALNHTKIKSHSLSPKEEQAGTVHPGRDACQRWKKMVTSAQLRAMCCTFRGKFWLKAVDAIAATPSWRSLTKRPQSCMKMSFFPNQLTQIHKSTSPQTRVAVT